MSPELHVPGTTVTAPAFQAIDTQLGARHRRRTRRSWGVGQWGERGRPRFLCLALEWDGNRSYWGPAFTRLRQRAARRETRWPSLGCSGSRSTGMPLARSTSEVVGPIEPTTV